jgi:ABC-type antimicrobial peptide transport system permease subunit
VIGVPAGLVVGRLAWRAVAADLGVAAETPISALAVLAVAVAAVLLAVVLAVVPARTAAARIPADALRRD